VLAVRPTPDTEQRIYCDGLDRDRGAAIARAAYSGDPGLLESALIARVASSRQEYGLLIALNTEGAQFFPQERELLELYARHAAAVLDMAMALDESDRRHRAVSALLALSQELAQGGSGQDFAERLAAAVPAVLDCDHVSVCLDDEAIPTRLSSATEPIFFDTATDESWVSQLMSREQLRSLVTVPIVARDQFLGLLTVGVRHNPDRLRSSLDLLERLTGVAALAAPAIQNDRLVDELRYQTRHDVLTGLANRAGFAQHINDALTEADRGGSHVGLLFVDLDSFKHVNDVHGHDIGDEVLRQAAHRLRASVRSGDTIARLGGDEFAAILTPIASSSEVEAAADRLRAAFTDPFEVGGAIVSISASVGRAIWPDDAGGVDALIRHADSEMYREKPQDPQR
jgi:diguanylate cyclase (GGDEF)-like protein